MKPWKAEHAAGRITRSLLHNGQPNNGINVRMLWASAELQGFDYPFWMTFQQANELGGFVKNGVHGSPDIYASTFKKKDQADDGQETEAEIPFLNEYTVFNASQCEGLPQYFYAMPEPPKETLARSDRFFANTRADSDRWEPGVLCNRFRLRADAAFRDVCRR